jgi:hypothetical protein
MRAAKIPTILATTALAVAVFGSTPLGQAAGRLIVPNSSVGAAQLKQNAVTSKKVKDGTLLAADFKAGQLPAGAQGAKGDTGTKGDAGANGQPGPKGDAGSPGISGYQVVAGGQSKVMGAGGFGESIASCPAGKKAIGGAVDSDPDLALETSRPVGNGTQWRIYAKNVSANTGSFTTYAICANVG